MDGGGFEVIGEITDIEIIAKGKRLEIRHRLRHRYGAGNWRKMKGKGTVRLQNGVIRRVELHWYEAHGIGRRLMKIKRYLEEVEA